MVYGDGDNSYPCKVSRVEELTDYDTVETTTTTNEIIMRKCDEKNSQN